MIRKNELYKTLDRVVARYGSEERSSDIVLAFYLGDGESAFPDPCLRLEITSKGIKLRRVTVRGNTLGFGFFRRSREGYEQIGFSKNSLYDCIGKDFLREMSSEGILNNYDLGSLL